MSVHNENMLDKLFLIKSCIACIVASSPLEQVYWLSLGIESKLTKPVFLGDIFAISVDFLSVFIHSFIQIFRLILKCLDNMNLISCKLRRVTNIASWSKTSSYFNMKFNIIFVVCNSKSKIWFENFWASENYIRNQLT